MRSVRAVALFTLAVLVACGGQPPAGSARQNDDHWETVSDLRFTYGERCGTGPFEVRFPARDIEWGRRVTIEAYGPRSLPLHYSIQLDHAGRHSESAASFDDIPVEHTRCRTTEAAASADAGGGEATTSAPGGSVRAPAGAPIAEGSSVELAPPPALVPFDGELPRFRTLETGSAYFPRGVPERYGDDVRTWQSESELASGEIVVRIWLVAPSDFEGLVLRFRDETLVPDLPLDEYTRRFPERVLAHDARATEYHDGERRRIAALRARCDVTPTARECDAFVSRPAQPPPPPLAETRPAAPASQAGIDVDWIPGFWRWDASTDEYVWVAGTFVVRPVEVVAEAAITPPPAAPPPPGPAAPPEPPRELTVEVAPQPAPRVETIPAPPRIPGVVWVAGRWELRGTAWAWVPGAWQLPPMPGGRPVAPEIRERGGVRVYLPGGWIDIR